MSPFIYFIYLCFGHKMCFLKRTRSPIWVHLVKLYDDPQLWRNWKETGLYDNHQLWRNRKKTGLLVGSLYLNWTDKISQFKVPLACLRVHVSGFSVVFDSSCDWRGLTILKRFLSRVLRINATYSIQSHFMQNDEGGTWL